LARGADWWAWWGSASRNCGAGGGVVVGGGGGVGAWAWARGRHRSALRLHRRLLGAALGLLAALN